MELTRLLVEQGSPTCECGRPRLPLHCRYCGSTNIRGRQRNTEATPSGAIAKGYRCFRCATDFSEITPCKTQSLSDQAEERRVKFEAKLAEQAKLREESAARRTPNGGLRARANMVDVNDPNDPRAATAKLVHEAMARKDFREASRLIAEEIKGRK